MWLLKQVHCSVWAALLGDLVHDVKILIEFYLSFLSFVEEAKCKSSDEHAWLIMFVIMEQVNKMSVNSVGIKFLSFLRILCGYIIFSDFFDISAICLKQ